MSGTAHSRAPSAPGGASSFILAPSLASFLLWVHHSSHLECGSALIRVTSNHQPPRSFSFSSPLVCTILPTGPVLTTSTSLSLVVRSLCLLLPREPHGRSSSLGHIPQVSLLAAVATQLCPVPPTCFLQVPTSSQARELHILTASCITKIHSSCR